MFRFPRFYKNIQSTDQNLMYCGDLIAFCGNFLSIFDVKFIATERTGRISEAMPSSFSRFSFSTKFFLQPSLSFKKSNSCVGVLAQFLTERAGGASATCSVVCRFFLFFSVFTLFKFLPSSNFADFHARRLYTTPCFMDRHETSINRGLGQA